MYKIAVMGERDSIYGFASIGLDIYPITDTDIGHAGKVLKNLFENGYAIIYITESLYMKMQNEINKYSDQILPAIIPIPGVSGNTGIGIQRVKKSVERAVGSDILFGGQ